MIAGLWLKQGFRILETPQKKLNSWGKVEFLGKS